MNQKADQKTLLEHVPCDFCGSANYRTKYRKPDNWLWVNLFEYPVVECLDCGLVYVNPRPPFDEMGRFYPPGYHEDRDTEAHHRRYEIQAEFLPPLNREAVLDVGCARGDWLHFLKERYPNINVHGTDAFSKSVTHPDIVFHKGVLPECRLPDSFFDLVTAWAVLEHVHVPGAYFSEISRILKRGGRFIFLVTNADSLYGRMAYQEDVPRHLYHFTPSTIRGYAKKYGFFVERIVFDDRLWDGRGLGTFRHLFRRIAGIAWWQLKGRQCGILDSGWMKAGAMLDAVVFSTHWEARLRRSGIMVAELIKS